MLNKTFMFHYQLNQNNGCNVKFVVNMNRHRKRLSSRLHRHQAAILLAQSLPLGYPANDAGLTFGKLS